MGDRRPLIDAELRTLIRRVVREDRLWGWPAIQTTCTGNNMASPFRVRTTDLNHGLATNARVLLDRFVSSFACQRRIAPSNFDQREVQGPLRGICAIARSIGYHQRCGAIFLTITVLA